MNAIAFINNCSANPAQYIVARLWDGNLWYYGSWPTREGAEAACAELDNGLIVERFEN